MASIESKKVTVLNSAENLFNFFSDLNNLEKLMPLDKTKDWESETDWCQVKVKGMGGLGMKLKSKTPNSEVILESMSDKPFPFELKITMQENGENADVQLFLDAAINPFMKMMVEKPLANFFDSLAEKLQEINQ